MKKLVTSILSVIFLISCTSNVPLNIRQPPTMDPSINEVRNDFPLHIGDKVRWGGTISTIENKASDTWLEIVGRRLKAYGRPYAEDKSLGRFLVRIDGFLDPDIYEAGREVTIYGVVESKIARQIDEHPYVYPLVKAETYYLWPDYSYRAYEQTAYSPYYYDPFLFPYDYYPYYGFGYRYYPYYGFGYRNPYRYHLGPRYYYR